MGCVRLLFLFTMTTNNVRYSSEKQLLLCYTMVFWIYTPFLNLNLIGQSWPRPATFGKIFIHQCITHTLLKNIFPFVFILILICLVSLFRLVSFMQVIIVISTQLLFISVSVYHTCCNNICN